MFTEMYQAGLPILHIALAAACLTLITVGPVIAVVLSFLPDPVIDFYEGYTEEDDYRDRLRWEIEMHQRRTLTGLHQGHVHVYNQQIPF